MSDLEDEIRNLRDTTESNRRQFLQVDLQTCFIALDNRGLGSSSPLGNTDEAKKGIRSCSSPAQQVVERLSSEMVKFNAPRPSRSSRS